MIFVVCAVHDTVIDVKENIEDIPGKLVSKTKDKIKGFLGKKEDSDSDSSHSSSSESLNHEQNGAVVEPEIQEPPKETRIDLIELIEGKLEDFDVEKILGTHDFCCPNCRSSTALRIILRKKLGSPGILEASPRPLPPTTPGIVSPGPLPPKQGRPLSPIQEPLLPPSHPGEPSHQPPPTPTPDPGCGEVFGCLQCFKLFFSRGKIFVGLYSKPLQLIDLLCIAGYGKLQN